MPWIIKDKWKHWTATINTATIDSKTCLERPLQWQTQLPMKTQKSWLRYNFIKFQYLSSNGRPSVWETTWMCPRASSDKTGSTVFNFLTMTYQYTVIPASGEFTEENVIIILILKKPVRVPKKYCKSKIFWNILNKWILLLLKINMDPLAARNGILLPYIFYIWYILKQ